MLAELTARSHLGGGRIELSCVWTGSGERPALRLVRRREAHPAHPDDGYVVLSLGELFREPDTPWAGVSHLRALAEGSGAEGGMLQGGLTLFFRDEGDSEPEVAEVSWYQAASGRIQVARIAEVTRLERTLTAPGGWGEVEEVELFHAPGGGAEESAGVLTFFRHHSDGSTPSRMLWEPTGAPTEEVAFDVEELLQSRAATETLTDGEVEVRRRRVARRDGATVALALTPIESVGPESLEEDTHTSLHESFSEEEGEWTRRIHVTDFRTRAEEFTYYRLFRRDPSDPARWLTERSWTTGAMATDHYGLRDRMYTLLPSVHRNYDEPAPEDRGEGQLRRYAGLFGTAMDHLRSKAEALRTRHDPNHAREDLLPALGGWIGWRTDRTQPLPIQRAEIRMAPEVFRGVGTLPNVRALAGRATGWECRVKELVHNLFLTNAPEYVPVQELREMAHDAGEWEAPELLSTTEHFDGRPAPVLRAPGEVRLFWHSNRAGRWELWTREVGGGGDPEAEPLDPIPHEEPPATHSDLSPSALLRPDPGGDRIWLFWESDREGAWDIWGRTEDGSSWGTPFRVTDHPAPDRRPAAALGPDDTLWVFWESARRGGSEIWGRSHDGARWNPGIRITAGPGRDRDPAAALDGTGRFWLVWRRDEAGRSNLWTSRLDGTEWTEEEGLEEGPWRDESPFLIRRGGELWLLWHSDRTGRWELWGRVHDGSAWDDPFQITRRPGPDKEPAAILDGGRIRVFWRSERPDPAHRSRTVDTRDRELLERRGRFEDRIHYTYDTAREDGNLYARDVVGLYLKPPPGTGSEEVDEVLARARTYMEPFRPATVRFVLVTEADGEVVEAFADGVDLDNPLTDTFTDEIE